MEDGVYTRSPLHYALSLPSRLDVIVLLLHNFAPTEILDRWRETPLFAAGWVTAGSLLAILKHKAKMQLVTRIGPVTRLGVQMGIEKIKADYLIQLANLF